jgi:hypothetical protein
MSVGERTLSAAKDVDDSAWRECWSFLSRAGSKLEVDWLVEK